MTNSPKDNLQALMTITHIFEKEVILLVYYILFSVLSLEGDWFNVQLVFFTIGMLLQVYCKWKNIYTPWNNFIGLFSFIIGSILGYQKDLLVLGILVFIFSISFISFAYERWHHKIKSKIGSVFANFVYSSVVLMSFPILYFIFLKNKLGINLVEFFKDPEHLLVFSGYFVFYTLLLLNKQLIAIQAVLLHKR